jgi:signal peptidase I
MVSVIATALVLSIVVRTFIFQAFYVPSESMENTLIKNDRIVVNKVSTKITGIHRGDVVVFHDPGGWLGDGFPNPYDSKLGRFMQFVGVLPSNSGNDLVKRVVGIGNDTLECCDVDGHILVNGRAVKENYTKPGNGTSQVSFKVIVPEGKVFVMGDNRGNSEDSRYHLDLNNGMVPVSEIVGRVSLKVWPLSRFGGIER